MHILALDLGTHTGFARTIPGSELIEAGTWHLASKSEVTAWGKQRLTRRDDPRIHRLAEKLGCEPVPDVVIFEDVEFQTYTLQCQLWASLRTVVWLSFGEHSFMECVPVTTLKKFATGNGWADKAGMLAAIRKRFPAYDTAGLDDNAIDAIWLHHWASTKLSRAIR
jgi:hypothetical protein